MPIYEQECKNCREVYEVVRSVKEYNAPYGCPACGGPTTKLYSLTTPKTFPSYSSSSLGGDITSYRQEKALLKKHGRVLTQDTPQWDKFKGQRKAAKKKRIYSTAVGTTRMNRD